MGRTQRGQGTQGWDRGKTPGKSSGGAGMRKKALGRALGVLRGGKKPQEELCVCWQEGKTPKKSSGGVGKREKALERALGEWNEGKPPRKISGCAGRREKSPKRDLGVMAGGKKPQEEPWGCWEERKSPGKSSGCAGKRGKPQKSSGGAGRRSVQVCQKQLGFCRAWDGFWGLVGGRRYGSAGCQGRDGGNPAGPRSALWDFPT